MFISQVTFEGPLADEPTLRALLRRKLESTQSAPGLLAAECWRSQTDEAARYTLVTKWEAQQPFKAWLAQSHAGQKRGGPDAAPRPTFSKTAAQYESVAFE